MFNIVIEQLPNKYLYINHTNPTIDTAQLVSEVFNHFKFESVIPPDIFTARLMLRIAAEDSKKKPSFRLSIGPFLAENGSHILGISFPSRKVCYFHETGTRASALYNFPDKTHNMARVSRYDTNLIVSNTAPTVWNFSEDT